MSSLYLYFVPEKTNAQTPVRAEILHFHWLLHCKRSIWSTDRRGKERKTSNFFPFLEIFASQDWSPTLPLRRIVSRDHSQNSRLLRPLFICLEGCNRNTVVWLLQSTNISGANFGCDVLALSSAAHNLSPDEKNFEWVPNLGCHISLDCPIGIIS